MPSGSAFKVTYPSSVSVASSTLTKCQVLHNTVIYTLTGCSVDIANRVVTIATGFNSAVNAGDSVAITFGPVINPNTQRSPGTLTLQSYTDSTFRFFID